MSNNLFSPSQYPVNRPAISIKQNVSWSSLIKYHESENYVFGQCPLTKTIKWL